MRTCLFLPVLQAGKSQVKVPADPVSAEGQLPCLQMAVFSLQLMCQREKRKEKRGGDSEFHLSSYKGGKFHLLAPITPQRGVC